ncbi:MAG: hypothetical protein QM781_08915 [Chitinophagaceae bacterium]
MKQFVLIFSYLLILSAATAQAPQSFNYQGVARNASGVPYASQQLSVKASVITGAPGGAVEYSETRTVTTNAFGLFNIQIGSAGATVNSGSFAGINWSQGIKYLQTEISINAQPYVNLGTTQILSVPYALHSKESKDLIFPFSKTGVSLADLFSISNTDNTPSSSAVRASATSGRAFYGTATSGVAAYLQSNDGTALYAYSPNKTGIMGISNGVTGTGVSAINTSGGLALGVNGNLRIYGGNTSPGAGKVLTSDASGNATWQPSASSTATIGFIANNPAQGGLQNLPNGVKYKVHAAVEDFDGSNNYTLSNQSPASTFTATVAGMHRFQAKIQISTSNTLLSYADLFLVVKKNNTETETAYTFGGRNVGSTDIQLDHTVYLNPGDQVWLSQVSRTDNGSNPTLTRAYFSGYRIK